MEYTFVIFKEYITNIDLDIKNFYNSLNKKVMKYYLLKEEVDKKIYKVLID